MVAVRGSGTGLSPADLERVRDTLAAGRKPKVVFTKSAGQVAGQLGQIIGLTDPGLSDEWVMVRFGRDELPFSPADLAMAPRPAPRKAAAVPSPREESSLSSGSSSPASNPSGSGSKADEPVTVAEEAPAEPASDAPGASEAAGQSPAVTEAEAVVPPTRKVAEGSGAKGSGAGRSARKGGGRGKVAPASSLVVTLTYSDGEWMVSATQGAKSLAKPYLVKPAEALRMVSMLDVAGVREAVEEIVAAAREEALRRAEALRVELAEVEARLAELRDES